MERSKDPYFYKEVNYTDIIYLEQELKQWIQEYKIVYLKNVPSGMDYMDFYRRLTAQVGKPVAIGEDLHTGNATEEQWTEIRYDKNRAATFQYSNTRQPLHTDAAYTNFNLDINFFFCLQQADIGGATTFADVKEVSVILAQYEPELASRIEATEIHFGKGADQRKRSKIIYPGKKGLKANWNYYRVSPENDEEALNLRESFHHFLENKIVAGGLLHPVSLKTGECLFFHDDEVLHGRNAFYGNRHLIKGGLNFN